MDYTELITLIKSNFGTLIFAVFGAFILTGISIKEHSDRDEKDKMLKGQYTLYLLGWVIAFPILGFGIALAYLGSGNHFNGWLALQIGLTSPAIIVGLANGGANFLSSKGEAIAPEQ